MPDSEKLTPIVLVQNERTAGGAYDHWQDATGERYQYPNNYKNLIAPGRRFVYYRGSRRRESTNAVPEYFGHGTIGEVSVDPLTNTDELPKRNWKWICSIGDYWPFEDPVKFKRNGVPFEKIAQNRWGTAVREIPESVFEDILASAGATDSSACKLVLPDLDQQRPRDAEQGLLIERVARRTNAGGKTGNGALRRSRYSSEIGRRGEEIALAHLQVKLSSRERATLRWVSEDRDKPGWDIEYTNEASDLIAVEVKATSGGRFPSVELTANEWSAAKRLRRKFHLLLVANVLSKRPVVEELIDPAGMSEAGNLSVTPTAWKIEAPRVQT